MKILLVEDDKYITTSLLEKFHLERFEVIATSDGDEALRLAMNNPFDLILLDLMLPGRSGDDILRHLRTAGLSLPIIVITGLDNLYTKVQMFDLGADDYLIKPFDFPELLARIKAAMRKQKIEIGNQLKYHDVQLDLKRHEASRNGRTLVLREKEIKILEYFLMHPEHVLSREMITNYVWGINVEHATNVVDVHIHHLREQIDKPYSTKLVKTISPIGYKLCK